MVLGALDREYIPRLMRDTDFCQIDVKITNN